MLEDDEFDSSPRPAKKRRVTATAAAAAAAKTTKKSAPGNKTSSAKSDEYIAPDEDDDVPILKPRRGRLNTIINDSNDEDAAIVVKPKRGRPKKVINDSDDDNSVVSKKGTKRKNKQSPATANGGIRYEFKPPTVVKKTKARKKQSAPRDSDDEGSVISANSVRGKSRNQTPLDEYDDDGFGKPQKPKYAIHIPSADNLRDVYLDPSALPPSTAPWEIRGAIWKKDIPGAKSVFDVVPSKPAPPPPPKFQESPPTVTSYSQHVQPKQPVACVTTATTQVRSSLAKFMAPPPPAKPFDIPASDDLDPEDWAQLDEGDAQSAALRESKSRVPVTKQSDIPDSDDLDPEDWAQLNDGDAGPVGRKPGLPYVESVSARHPTVMSKRVEKPADRSAPPIQAPHLSEPAEDSMMIDDIDPDDWALLESNDVDVPTTDPQVGGSPRTTVLLPRQAQSPQSAGKKTATKQATSVPARASDACPFIIDDDSSDNDDFARAPPAPVRPKAGVSTSKAAPPARGVKTVSLRQSQSFGTISRASVSEELADLPSDAFDSDEDDTFIANAPNEVVYVESQNRAGVRKPNLAAPTNGLVQTTLFGGKAQPQDAVAVANKRHAWPLATQKEAETHHKLDPEAVKSWVYPTNLGTIRDYQYNIVARGLFHNLLVALPTGLGKTFIAATIMLNWFRWAPESQIVFVAPTKPLVAQQIDACFKVVGIPRSETVMLTGETKPAIRAEEWKEKRVFFMTPQTIINDLKHGYCDPKRIVLVVVDEAHRATGGYAYVEVIKFLRRFNQSFRVLALTATPGANVEAVQQVIDGLDISRVEIRTETSIDIRQYVHDRGIDTMKFDFSDEQHMIMELLSKAIQPVLNKLNGQNAYWVKDPMKLTAYGCTMAQRQWSQSDAGRKAPGPIKGMVSQIFPVLAGLAHGISLLKFHGIGSFHRAMADFRNNVDGGMTKGKYALQIRQDQNFNKMMSTVQGWTKNPDFLGHPKLDYLRRVVLNHFMDHEKKTETRIMIFAHWRDSAEEIVRVMQRNEPMIRPHVFVGQATAKGSEGMGQKRQLEVIKDFKEGKYNTLVATSIGEEGLDIGEVDLIVCYDASASPIRMLQRMGRTGRKRKGNICLLLMRGKEDDDFEKAKDNYEKMQAMISEGTRFTFHDDKSPRILPRGTNPVVDKRMVEIPIENSQADLPEPNRRKRVPKKPPKKFHMPDNVRTGFVSVSRMDASDEEAEAAPPKAVKARSKAKKVTSPVTKIAKAKAPTAEIEAVALPFLKDVLLNKVQERELERKYQYVNDADDGAPTVTAPRLDRLMPSFPGPTRLVRHGRGTLTMASMMQRIHEMSSDGVQTFQDNLRLSSLTQNVDHLIGDPEVQTTNDEEDEADLPALPTLPKSRVKEPIAAKPRNTKSAAARSATQKAKVKPKPRARVRQDSSDMEGDDSEPEPTPANMRIGTQGIDIGSDDTMGEDEDDGEPDSELAEFVVGSDAPIEMVSSSMPGMHDEDSDDLPDFGGEEDQEEVRPVSPVRKRLQRKSRQIVEDDSDE